MPSERVNTTSQFHEALMQQALYSLGVSDLEAQVFVRLLPMKSQPVSAIARQAKLNRVYCYELLSSLERKGFVEMTKRNSVRHFTALTPEKILEMFERREREISDHRSRLRSILPEIMRADESHPVEPRTRIFEGLEGIKSLFHGFLQAESNLLSISHLDNSFTLSERHELMSWQRAFLSKRRTLRVWHRALLVSADDPETNRCEDRLLETRSCMGPKLEAEILVSGERIAFISTAPRYFGVVIDNGEIARSLATVHEMVWETGLITPESSTILHAAAMK